MRMSSFTLSLDSHRHGLQNGPFRHILPPRDPQPAHLKILSARSTNTDLDIRPSALRVAGTDTGVPRALAAWLAMEVLCDLGALVAEVRVPRVRDVLE